MLKLFKNKDGKFVVVQAPNVALAGWFILLIAGMLIADTGLKGGLAQLSKAFLFVWAYMEIKSGASPFRRLLGAVVIAILIIGYFW